MVSALYKLTARERRSYNKTLHPLWVMARDVWPAEGLCSLGSEGTFGRRGLLGQGLKKKKSVWQWQFEGENRSRKREVGWHAWVDASSGFMWKPGEIIKNQKLHSYPTGLSITFRGHQGNVCVASRHCMYNGLNGGPDTVHPFILEPMNVTLFGKWVLQM